MALPSEDDYDQEEAKPWERMAGEPSRQHAAFRMYRDLPVGHRRIDTIAAQVDVNDRQVRTWASKWEWRERADAWDDACHRIEDQERIDAIRAMHKLHRSAGRAALVKAYEALDMLDPARMPPPMVAKFLELGAKLERQTVIVSVEELQGFDDEGDEDDPWERIAAELDPHP